jgi:hypothetical protein
MKISTWLKSGVIDENIKDTLETTLGALCSACPLKPNKKSLLKSLRDVLNKDQEFRKKTEANIKVHGWLNSIFEPAKFNKKRYVGQYSDTNSEAPPVQEFSFSANEQGAFVETFYALIEVELYTFLYKNAGIIPFKTVEAFAKKQRPKIKPDFENADTLCMINFIIENIEIFTKKSAFNNENPLELFKDYKKSVRNKMAHGVAGENGRWSDIELQNVSLLSCKIVKCLGK